MIQIDPEIESRMIKYIRTNLDEILEPKFQGQNPGVGQYDLLKEFGFLSSNGIRDYLIVLEEKGELQVVDDRSPGLKFYLPVDKKEE